MGWDIGRGRAQAYPHLLEAVTLTPQFWTLERLETWDGYTWAVEEDFTVDGYLNDSGNNAEPCGKGDGGSRAKPRFFNGLLTMQGHAPRPPTVD